jgi:hypothetical protein
MAKSDDFSIELQSKTDKTYSDGSMVLQAEASGVQRGEVTYEWKLEGGGMLVVDPTDRSRAIWRPLNAGPGKHIISVTATQKESGTTHTSSKEIEILAHASAVAALAPAGGRAFGGGGDGKLPEAAVSLRRSETTPTDDLALWVVIRKATEALNFDNYSRFMDIVLCGATAEKKDGLGHGADDYRDTFKKIKHRRFLPYTDADAYRLLKAATEAFVMVNCGVSLNEYKDKFGPLDDDLLVRRGITPPASGLQTVWTNYLAKVNGTSNQTLPYLALIREKLRDNKLIADIVDSAICDCGGEKEGTSDGCEGVIRSKLTNPCFLELIWSYWHEEGMLVQTLNAITARFQNLRGPMENDPLRMMEIDPLRPANNLIWGYIQDEQHRLTVVRRVYEYDHHYGLTLYGKAVPRLQPADSRSKFIEAFHNLLYLCAGFYKQDDDTTIIADGFPILNALKEVHLLLTEGAHNQYGDLPSTARIEMLMQQWVLGRPEFREYLPTRTMVAYPERWMDRVDAMKTLQRWTDTPVLHFRNLGVFGEQVLLSIRFGAWTTVNEPVQAANWARFWRAEIQGYVHAYRAVTAVDLTSEAAEARQKELKASQPWVHLRNRLVTQQQRRA